MTVKLVKRIIRWALFAMILLYGLSGYGITEFRVVEAITFGLLTKAIAFKIHNNFVIPFAILLSLHIFWPLVMKLYHTVK
ncbi:hypothetical protein ACFLWY_01970 [Chloroflexota bacterium]